MIIQMNKHDLQRMKTLRNIGPACAEQLVTVGITTPEKLRALGAEDAFLKNIRKYTNMNCVNANYLYALYGAIHDLDWRDIPRNKKEEFKQFTKSVRENFNNSLYTSQFANVKAMVYREKPRP